MNQAENNNKKRVLVIDDNIDAAESLAQLLLLLGFDATAVNDGRTGLALAPQLLPDVVMLDLGMPDMTGYEVALAMRKIPVMENVVIAALTGWNDTATRARVVAAGFDHHLTKPADIPTILAIINNAAPLPPVLS